jgi:RNA polymerase sigma-70 factor (ECF subfamily)
VSGSPSISIDALLAQTSWLRRLAIHLVSDPDKASDLVHETWAVALEKPPKPGVDLRRWLAKVLRNRAKNRYRDDDLQAFHEKSASRSEETSSVEDTERRASIQKQVADAVYRLEEPYRTPITLFYYDELSADEIARRLQTTPVNVRKLLSRGREMLRARLDREFGGREAWCLVFIEMLRKGAAAPVAVGTGKVIGLTAAALAILSLLVWRRVRSPMEERQENKAAPAVAVDGGREPLPPSTR